MGSGKKTTVGYYYYLGIHSILCRGPIDEVQAIYFDEKLAWQGNVTASQQILVDKRELFGGENAQGGVYGNVDVMLGEETQQKNSYLQAKIATLIPAFRGVVSLVFRSFYISAMTPYLKSPSVQIKRLPSRGWRPDIADIDGACNPAHAILEIITSPEYGLGEAIENCDMDLFESVAQTLYDESFGLSFTINGESSVKDIIQMIMDHIGGIFTTDIKTGLHKIILFRDNYNINTLTLLNPDNCEVLSFERPSYSELCNEIVASYRPRGKFKDDTITLQDIAAVQSQGNVVSQSVSYPAIDNPDLAARVAARDLKIKSTPLAKVKVKTDRRFWNFSIGDVLAFQWEDYSINRIALRIIDIDYGNIGDGAIIIEAVEDIFGLAQATYYVNQESGWIDESQAPVDATNFKLIELGYWDAVKNQGETEAANIDPSSAFLMSAMGNQSYLTTSFELWTPTGNGVSQTNIIKEYPLYDLYLTASITDIDTIIPLNIEPRDFYWIKSGSQIVISDNSNTETMTVVSITSGQIEVEPRSGFAFSADSYVYAGYGENNPIRIGQDISDTDTNISAWISEPTEVYILENEYYAIDDEIVLVVTAPGGGYGSTDILRAQKGTTAAPHKTGRFMRRIYQSVNLTNQYELRDIGSPAPFCVTRKTYGRTSVSLSGISFKGDPLSIRIGSYAYWEDEIVEVQYISESLVIVGRGCLDTVPVPHNSGSIIIFAEDYQAISSYEYIVTEDVECKLLPRNGQGLLALADATAHTLTMVGRFNAPYPPGKFRINTEAYPEVITGVASLTWAHRDRITQTASLVTESMSSIGPEVGVTYNLRIYGETDTLVRSVTTSGASYSFTDEIVACGLWDETESYVQQILEDGETALSGWYCLQTSNVGGGHVLHYDTIGFIGSDSSYSGSGPIIETFNKFVRSDVIGKWSDVAASSGLTGYPQWVTSDGSSLYLTKTSTGTFSSSDLITWTAETFPSTDRPYWDGTQFIAALSTSDLELQVSVSTDGSSWTSKTLTTLTSGSSYDGKNYLKFLGVFGGKYYLLYNYFYGNALFVSTDLDTWTDIYNAYTQTVSSVAGSVVPFATNSLTSVHSQVAYMSSLWIFIGGDYNTNPDLVGRLLLSTDGTTLTQLNQEDFIAGCVPIAICEDGTNFYAIVQSGGVSGDFYSAKSSDGSTWVLTGLVQEYVPGSSHIIEYFSARTGEVIVSWNIGTVDNRKVYHSTDETTSWKLNYPTPPTVELDPTSAEGTNAILYSVPAGAGYCQKDFSPCVDYETQEVKLEGFLQIITGTDPLSSEFYCVANQNTGANGYGIKITESGVYLVSYELGIASELLVITTALALDTYYYVSLVIKRNFYATINIYESDMTPIDSYEGNIVTPIELGTNTSTSSLGIDNPGLYDLVSVETKQHYPRYNASLRFELESERDTAVSLQMINYTVTRDVLLP